MARGGGGLFFIIYLLLGLYFLNFGLNFVKIPETFSKMNNWIIFAGGVLLIFGAIRFLMTRRPNVR